MKRFLMVLGEFFRLKFEETRYFWIVVGSCLCLVFTPWQVGRWINLIPDVPIDKSVPWIIGIVILGALAVIVLLVIWCITDGWFVMLGKWIKSNWRMANENVDKRLGGNK